MLLTLGSLFIADLLQYPVNTTYNNQFAIPLTKSLPRLVIANKRFSSCFKCFKLAWHWRHLYLGVHFFALMYYSCLGLLFSSKKLSKADKQFSIYFFPNKIKELRHKFQFQTHTQTQKMFFLIQHFFSNSVKFVDSKKLPHFVSAKKCLTLNKWYIKTCKKLAMKYKQCNGLI